MKQENLNRLLDLLTSQTRESEWIEFKHNYHSCEEIGESLSALANGACLTSQAHGYLIFGVQDGTLDIIGTTFKPRKEKKGNEEIEHWIAQRLRPRVDFTIYEFEYRGKEMVIFEVQSAYNQPVEFMNHAHIRVGTYTRKLGDFPQKARKIWNKGNDVAFEGEIARKGLSAEDIVSLLDTQTFFDMLNLPYPSDREGVIEKLLSEKLIKFQTDDFGITNLGALLFAKDLREFEGLTRKAPRVIIYKGKNKIQTVKDQVGQKGYAVGFQRLVSWITDQLPTNEAIESAIRKQVHVYPELAVRELVANALIHQDFSLTGTGPAIEIFSDRIEITNPGLPLITTIRFIDEYQSRNEVLASLMRRLGICEEKGSGIDKVVQLSEVFQLPAPNFVTQEKHTEAILYAPKTLNEMDKKDRIRSCYQHCCLKYVSNDKMTNQSLRERFKIEDHNAAIASRIIKETLEQGLVKEDDSSSRSRKFASYVPFWA